MDMRLQAKLFYVVKMQIWKHRSNTELFIGHNDLIFSPLLSRGGSMRKEKHQAIVDHDVCSVFRVVYTVAESMCLSSEQTSCSNITEIVL